MISRVSDNARRLLPSSVLSRTDEPMASSYSLRRAASAFCAWAVACPVVRSASCWALISALAALMPSFRPATVALYSSLRRPAPCVSSRTALRASRLLCKLARACSSAVAALRSAETSCWVLAVAWGNSAPKRSTCAVALVSALSRSAVSRLSAENVSMARCLDARASSACAAAIAPSCRSPSRTSPTPRSVLAS